MMKLYININIILFLFFTCESISLTNIYVFDDDTKEPVPFVRITAWNQVNEIDSLVSVMTNKSGKAEILLNTPFHLSISHVGYDTVTIQCVSYDDMMIPLKRKVFILDEVVTTGQFTPQSSQKSVYKINTISEERIISQSAFNLRELLMTEMNIRVSQDNILGSSMSINGLSGQNVKIMIDGVPVIGRLNGNVDLSQINLNNARRVEIVEGPMSAIYGTDALGGVVNIITKDEVEEDYFLNANSYVESVGIYNFDGSVGLNLSDYNLMLSGGRNFFAGFSEVDTSRFKRWKPKEQYFGDLQLNHFADWYSLRYMGQFMYEHIMNRGLPRPPYRETAFDDHYKTNRLANTLSFKGEIAHSRFFEVIANYSTYTRIKNTYFKDLLTLNERLTSEQSDQDTNKFDNFMLRAVYSHDNILNSVSYRTGLDFNFSKADGRRIDESGREIGDYAVFGSVQLNFPEDMTLQSSLRYIKNTKYDAPLIPSINLKYDINDVLSLRASYAKGFRAPSLQELHFLFVDINHNIIGNTNLNAERSDSYILGLNFHQVSESYSFKIESSIFYNNVQDLISLANIENDVYTYMNIGEYNTSGINASLSYIRPDLNLRLGFSLTGRQYKSTGLIDATDFIITPEVMLNLIYSLPLYDINLNLFYKYSGKLIGFYAVSDVEYDKFEIGDYHTMDISLSKELGDKFVTLVAGIKNLFDVTEISRIGSDGNFHSDASTSNPVAWGRTVNVSIRFNLK